MVKVDSMRRIVILGANAAGTSAAAAARRTDKEAEIILIESEKYPAYSRCGLPYVLSGQVQNFEDLVIFPPKWYEMMNLDLRLGTVAKTIGPADHVLMMLEDGKEKTIHYDSLILATGCRSSTPSIKGADKEGVYSLRTIDDGKRLQEAMKEAHSAVVIGAGMTGLETTHAFDEKNIVTTIAEASPQVCPTMLDMDTANLVTERLEDHGVNVITGSPVKEIVGTNQVEAVVVEDRKIQADIVLVATGARINNELGMQIGALFGVTGGLKVGADMSTSIPDIYSCGDGTECYSLIDGQPIRSQLRTTAARQGEVAGRNAAGGYTIFPGSLCSRVTKVFGFEIGSTGYTELHARGLGYKTISGSVDSRTRAEYFPGGQDIRVKLIVERDYGRIIGSQIVSGEETTQRVNMLATAIQNKMTVSELSKTDCCYSPPVNVTLEPVILAAEIAVSRLKTLNYPDGSPL